VQLVALLLDQFSVLEPPTATEVGLAVNVTVGAGVELATVTVTERLALAPPLAEHANVKVLVALSGPTISFPDRPLFPLHAPLAAQLSAFDEFHVSCELPP
jgi:hypothetical protein